MNITNIYKHMKIINIYLHLEENCMSDQGFITHTKWFLFVVHNYINLKDRIPSMFVYIISSLPLYNSQAHTASSLLLISVTIFYGLRINDYIYIYRLIPYNVAGGNITRVTLDVGLTYQFTPSIRGSDE